MRMALDQCKARANQMGKFFIVSEVARRLGVLPRQISDAFYSRKLDDQLCPIVGGRRMIPESYLPEVERIMVKDPRTVATAGK